MKYIEELGICGMCTNYLLASFHPGENRLLSVELSIQHNTITNKQQNHHGRH